jgi:hypothetical protein
VLPVDAGHVEAGKPVFAASASETVLFPDPASR